MNWEGLKKVNSSLETMDIKGKDYVEVNKRVMAFRELEPNGSIVTDIISLENGVVVMKAIVTDGDGKILGTGLAYEKESSSFINKTSYIENCETSAVGRALGFCGIGITTSIASAEEVANAIKQQNEQKNDTKPKKQEKVSAQSELASNKEKNVFIATCQQLGVDPIEIAKQVGVGEQMTAEQYAKCMVILQEIRESRAE